MAVFVAIAVLMCVLVLGAVLWPLRGSSRGVMMGLALSLCVATGALYRIVGTPAGLDVKASAAATPQTLEQAVAALRDALKQNPQEVEGWVLLGRTLSTQGDAAGALQAFEKALALQTDSPDLMVDVAQARTLTHPQRLFDGQALGLLQSALALQPKHQRATWFMGVAQRQQGKPAEAAKTWEPLLAVVDEATAASLRPQINAARAEAQLPPLAEAVPVAPAAGAKTLTVKVALDPDFAARVRLRGDASVFVIARQPGGPPMPVAVEKHSISDLPLTVTLDDGDSPMPTVKLSALDEVEVFARISSSGSATKQEGDMDSAVVKTSVPAQKPVELWLGK